MRRLRLLVVLLALALTATLAQAAYIYPWSAVPLTVDVYGDSSPSTDLVDVWWARDGAYDYFRFDLPTAADQTVGRFYGAYIDITAGVFFNPSILPFADALIGVEWTDVLGSYGWTPFITNGVYTSYSAGMVQGQLTENAGTSVEFRLDSTQGIFPLLPRDYTWAGVSGIAIEPDFLSGHTPLDYVAARDTVADTPEPATLVLLPLGATVLVGRLRRRKAART